MKELKVGDKVKFIGDCSGNYLTYFSNYLPANIPEEKIIHGSSVWNKQSEIPPIIVEIFKQYYIVKYPTDNDRGFTQLGFLEDSLELVESCNSNEPTNSSINKVGKIMSKLTSFVKNSLLSADEKLLRKYGLKDECGEYTGEANAIVLNKLIKENEAYLVEVATAMLAEEKANK